MRTAGLQKFTAAFRLSWKTLETSFSAIKNCILRNLQLNIWQKVFIISLDGQKVEKCSLQLKPG